MSLKAVKEVMKVRNTRLNLKSEKSLLFLLIITLTFFVFSSGLKGQPLTGAVLALDFVKGIDFVEDANYIVAAVIIAIIIALIIYFSFLLRRPRPTIWHLEPFKEEPSELLRPKHPLERKLEHLDQVLEKLKSEKIIPYKAPVKKTRLPSPSVAEKVLEKELSRVNAKIYSPKKPEPAPSVIAPVKREKKKQLDLELAEVERMLNNIERITAGKKKRIIISTPQVSESGLILEKKPRLQNELKKINTTLSEGRKNPSTLVRDIFAWRRGRGQKKAEKKAFQDLQEIELKIEAPEFGQQPHRSELFEIEQELKELRGEIRKEIRHEGKIKK